MNKLEADQIFTEDLYKLPRRVLVLLPEPWQSLNPADETLLRKILASVKLPLEGVQVLSQATADLNSLKVYNPSHILSFGSQLDSELKLFTPTVIDEIRIIQSESLNTLDDTKKKSLWLALKQAFTS